MNRLNRSCVLTASLIALAAATAQAQLVSDDFSSGNDDVWRRLDGPGTWAGAPTTYSVVNNSYRIQTPAYAGPIVYLTNSFRDDGLALDSRVAVDIVDWNDSLRQNMQVMLRTTPFNPDPNQYQSYLCNFTNHGSSNASVALLSIYRLSYGGAVATLAQISFAASLINTSHVYRLEFSAIGHALSGKLIDVSVNPNVTIRTVQATDNSALYIDEAGFPGVSIWSNQYLNGVYQPTDTTFDNFIVTSFDPVPCPADWNSDGVASSQDFFDFISGFFTDNADFNDDGQTTSQDFFDFLAAFFAGC